MATFLRDRPAEQTRLVIALSLLPELLGHDGPDEAYTSAEFWANRPDNPQSAAWLEQGWCVERFWPGRAVEFGRIQG